VKTELAGIDHPPQIAEFKKLAEKKGVKFEDLLKYLEEGSGFNRGLKALMERRYTDAIRLFEKYTKADTTVQSRFYLGNALYYTGQYGKAVVAYQKTVKAEPGFFLAWNNWGLVLNGSGKYGEAAEKFRKAVEIDESHAGAWNGWGMALTGLGKFREASKKYRMAVKNDPADADTWNDWGVALNQRGKFQDAAKKYREAVRLDPAHVNAWNNWGGGIE
ncbi:MAG: tetratricopeptide repeat protein, partial [bacterium]|nr:tetratricopeptide repeat protein [bacterium]